METDTKQALPKRVLSHFGETEHSSEDVRGADVRDRRIGPHAPRIVTACIEKRTWTGRILRPLGVVNEFDVTGDNLA